MTHHNCRILSAVASAASLNWMDGHFCSCLLPSPAAMTTGVMTTSLLTSHWWREGAEDRGTTESILHSSALLSFCSPNSSFSPSHLYSSSSAVPLPPPSFFFIFYFLFWSMTSKVYGSVYYHSGERLSCQFPQLWTCQWQHCLQRQRGTSRQTRRVNVWVTFQDQVEE